MLDLSIPLSLSHTHTHLYDQSSMSLTPFLKGPLALSWFSSMLDLSLPLSLSLSLSLSYIYINSIYLSLSFSLNHFLTHPLSLSLSLSLNTSLLCIFLYFPLSHTLASPLSDTFWLLFSCYLVSIARWMILKNKRKIPFLHMSAYGFNLLSPIDWYFGREATPPGTIGMILISKNISFNV